MTELRPIGDDVPAATGELASALRELFQGLKVSVRRYSARRAYDSATVSRYLGGRRVPPWEFVSNLVYDVAEKRGLAPTEEAVTLLRALHSAALLAGGSPHHRQQLLERRLAEADLEARRAEARERRLEDQLLDAEHRIRDLEVRHRVQLASDALPLPDDNSGTGTTGDDFELSRLRRQVAELTEELDRVRVLHLRAEERCAQLEHQLARAEAEGQAEAALEGVVVPADPSEAAPEPGGGEGAGAAPTGVVRNQVVSSPGSVSPHTVYQFGHVNGGLTVVSDGWNVDEEHVAAVTVRLWFGRALLANGLLLDSRTVVAPVPSADAARWHVALGIADARRDLVVETVAGERAAAALGPHESYAYSGSLLGRFRPTLALLHLKDSVTAPDRPPAVDWRFTPGSKLLVSGRTATERYSCVLDVTRRVGDWLHTVGDLVPGLHGAPAFSSSGQLAGLVVSHDLPPAGGVLVAGRQPERGLLLSAAALHALPGFDPGGSGAGG
ncbi:hypothetical protein [Streptomyces sp. NRRL S-87]|uniref:hypothetical protein n=1 Tax=Streptomyces sp. NRRL S-87 TaxID=1463920 RepID=UPI0006891E22|nr:hypothetical protein [Streptomyces sp. NRRL S-87]